MGFLFDLLFQQSKCIKGLSQRQYIFKISEECSQAELRFLTFCPPGLMEVSSLSIWFAVLFSEFIAFPSDSLRVLQGLTRVMSYHFCGQLWVHSSSCWYVVCTQEMLVYSRSDQMHGQLGLWEFFRAFQMVEGFVWKKGHEEAKGQRGD